MKNCWSTQLKFSSVATLLPLRESNSVKTSSLVSLSNIVGD